eukprot:1021591-Pyramimonas_sp.AAC.1
MRRMRMRRMRRRWRRIARRRRRRRIRRRGGGNMKVARVTEEQGCDNPQSEFPYSPSILRTFHLLIVCSLLVALLFLLLLISSTPRPHRLPSRAAHVTVLVPFIRILLI